MPRPAAKAQYQLSDPTAGRLDSTLRCLSTHEGSKITPLNLSLADKTTSVGPGFCKVLKYIAIIGMEEPNYCCAGWRWREVERGQDMKRVGVRLTTSCGI
jgi:hypothetical protein